MPHRLWTLWVSIVITLGVFVPPTAQAALPVVDLRAIFQMVEQLRVYRQQLMQLQQELSSMTGQRGLEALLPVAVGERNYLPDNLQAVADLARGNVGNYGALGAAVQQRLRDVTQLSDQLLAALPASAATDLRAARSQIATAAALADESYGTASLRFAQLDALRQAIAAANDPQALGELNARIAVEQAMVANETNKLAALRAAQQAETAALEHRAREAALAGIGSARRLPAVRY